MKHASSRPNSAPRSGPARLARPHRLILTALAGALALLAGSARTLAGPAPALPLEPAFELAAEARMEPVPLRWAGGWKLAKVTINGADAGWFLIVTGWNRSCIDPQVAARLKLPMVSVFGLMDGVNGPAGPSTKRYRVDGLQCGVASATDVLLDPKDMAEMSQNSVKMYGEGISGALGWDLLRTLPFVLDEPALQLEWQRVATPAEGATRVPVIEKVGLPFIEITAGTGCKILASLNSAEVSVSIQRRFLGTHADQLWVGPVRTVKAIHYNTKTDDDGVPVGKNVELLPSSRWLAVECGGLRWMLPADMQSAEINSLDKRSMGEVQLGAGWLRRLRVLFDGPGKALWLTPAVSTPEVELVRNGRPTPSPCLLETALSVAISFNDAAAVKALAAAGADVKGPPEFPPLADACASASREAALALLDAGAPVNSSSGKPTPWDPLLSACDNGDPALIKMLLEKGADPNRASLAGFTPLMAAARTGGPAAVQALRGKARLPKDPKHAAQILGEACAGGNLLLAKEMLALIPANPMPEILWPAILEQALLCGHADAVDWLLKTGGPGLASKGAELQPLLAAILPTRIEKTDAIRERLVAMLLAAGADPNAARKGVTPLLLAARHGNGGIVKALLAAGAKATTKDHKMRDPLMRAAAANQPAEVIEPLLKPGIDLDAEDPNTDRTILSTYAMHGNLEACAALLKAGADPNAKSTFGPTPLLMATNGARSTDEEALAVVNLLLKHDAKLEMSSGWGMDIGLLFGAIARDRSTLIKPLVDAGAPVNQEMDMKVTPLALAAATSDVTTVQALLDLGAEPKTLDVKGISPLAHAAAAGNTASMAALLAHGALPDATRPNEKPPVWVAASVGQLRAVRALLAAGADPDALNPQTKTTALDVAKSRRDQPMVTLLENHPRNKFGRPGILTAPNDQTSPPPAK
ncbi:MAG: ankyrin repeat domain-containing protein [Verrucomicrobia bacterium]|nr:ankyrin repeat domain-containing protein [Verrucomicrobiota bacterium]